MDKGNRYFGVCFYLIITVPDPLYAHMSCEEYCWPGFGLRIDKRSGIG